MSVPIKSAINRRLNALDGITITWYTRRLGVIEIENLPRTPPLSPETILAVLNCLEQYQRYLRSALN